MDGARGPRRDAAESRRRVRGQKTVSSPHGVAAAWRTGAARGVCTRTRPSNASVSKENSLCVSMPCVDNTQLTSAERKTKRPKPELRRQLRAGQCRAARDCAHLAEQVLRVLANLGEHLRHLYPHTHRQRLAHGLRSVVRMPALPPCSAESTPRSVLLGCCACGGEAGEGGRWGARGWRVSRASHGGLWCFVFVREGEQTEEDCCSWTFQGGQAATRARRCEIENRSIEPVM